MILFDDLPTVLVVKTTVRILTILLLSFVSWVSYLFGQDDKVGSMSVTIVDHASLEPCCYAHIGYLGTNLGTTSDERGTATIKLSEVQESIYISMVGYDQKDVSIQDIRDTIFLHKSVLALQEVVISSARKTFKVGGQHPRKKKIPWVHEEMIGTEIGNYFSELPLGKAIDAVHVFFRKNRCDSVLFRLRFYDSTSEGPQVAMDHPDIIYKTSHKKGWMGIPVSSYSIYTRKSMLVTIEALETWGNNSSQPDFSLSHDKKYTGRASSRRYSNLQGFGGYSYAGKGLAMHLELVE